MSPVAGSTPAPEPSRPGEVTRPPEPATGYDQAAAPHIVVVEDEDKPRARLEAALERRYGGDYAVGAHESADAGLDALARLRDAGERVALVLADQWMPGATGVDLLAQVRELHPLAKRGLLVEWGAWGDDPTAEAIVTGMNRGDIDYYVLKPWRWPDELFHRTVVEFLYEWSRTGDWTPQAVTVVGDEGSPRAQELRGVLARNGVPFAFRSSGSPEGRDVLAESGLDRTRGPVVRLLDGRVLIDPSRAELARAYGVQTSIEGSRHYDLVVVGAGPAGLAASVYGSSEGLRTLAVEAEAIGGQAGSSSLIRNYLGFARGVSGAELAQRAYQQAWVFGTRFMHMRRVDALEPGEDEHVLWLSDGTKVSARAVVLATGVSYRRLSAPSLEDLTGAGVFYGASTAEAQALRGGCVYVVGGGNSAGRRRSTCAATRAGSPCSYVDRRSRRACRGTCATRSPPRAPWTSAAIPRSWAGPAPAGSSRSPCATGARARPRRSPPTGSS